MTLTLSSLRAAKAVAAKAVLAPRLPAGVRRTPVAERLNGRAVASVTAPAGVACLAGAALRGVILVFRRK